MKNNGIFRRSAYSLAGLREGWRRERAVRSHVLFSALAIAGLVFFRPPSAWTVGVLVLLVVGLALELLNGALETTLDRLHPHMDPEIGAAKDMASAAVFVVNCATGLSWAAAIVLALS